MKYERITARSAKGLKLRKGKKYIELLADKELTKKALSRLADLEDKIENGTLVELPCKVGDNVFVIAKQGMDIYTVEETTVCDFWFSTTENRFYPFDVNEIPLEKVFLTKAEAEKQLENQRGAK